MTLDPAPECVVVRTLIVSPTPLTIRSQVGPPAVLARMTIVGSAAVNTAIGPPSPAAVRTTSGSPTPVTVRTTPGTVIVVGDGSGELEPDEYIHTQTIATPVWTINHNLGRRVAVTLTDLAGTEVDADVANPSLNQTVVNYLVPRTGYAIIN